MDDAQLDDLLARRDASIVMLTHALLDLVAALAPELSARVQPGWGSINFTHRRAGYVCAVLPQSEDVLLVFQHGRELSNPLLEDNGKVKKVRWIRFRPGDPLPEDEIAILLAEAIALRA
jgi:hypothetical protein